MTENDEKMTLSQNTQVESVSTGSSEPDTLEARQKKKTKVGLLIVAILLVGAVSIIAVKTLIRSSNYKAGSAAFDANDFALAEQKYIAAAGYKDASDRAILANKAGHYQAAEVLYGSERFKEAAEEFELAEDYQDAINRAEQAQKAHHYKIAEDYFESNRFVEAAEEYGLAKEYQDAEDKKVLAIKADHYQKAEELFAAKDYEESLKEYQLAEDYQDAAQKAEETSQIFHYQNAEAYFAKKDYEKAIPEYESSKGYQKAKERIQECSFQAGLIKLNAKDYEKAARLFKAAGTWQDAPEKEKEAYYKQGEELFLKKKYDDAIKVLENAKDYGNAVGLRKAAEAEKSIQKNDLNTAIQLYKEVPDNCAIEGFDIQQRKKGIGQLSTIAAVSGEWTASKNYIEVRNVWKYDGRWDSWYIDGTETAQKLTISYKINDDNTVTVTGRVSFYAFDDYSSLRKYCQAKLTSRSFTWDKIKSIPASTDLGKNATLKYSNGVFSLSYREEDNYSVNFYNVYSTTVTYGTKTK